MKEGYEIKLITNHAVSEKEHDFLFECMEEGVDYLEMEESMKWQRFEFYCRYGFFLGGN